MSGTIILASLAVVAGILLWLFNSLRDGEGNTNYALQIIILSFILGCILLIGKTAYEYKDNCSWLVSNSTSSGSTTSYEYSYTCDTNASGTPGMFYQITLWIMRIIALYVFLAFVWELIQFFMGKKKRDQEELQK